MLQLEKEK